MFNDTDNGQTQYCPMCLEWAEKYDELKQENEKLKDEISLLNCTIEDLYEEM